ncbi:MAG: helix-turn-helix transcriptional regulator [Flammeovirgaceae bacterium]|nr:helix-turn-helix transcriptional regulator [Flammeovirgaceae bacterium]MBE62365.1 helix-turn-helix transcriptional regulator [Flammeovirgaceae bacterium]HCX22805.1 helix-turn-helix transcriptional regulator [Cytophagales bacterium]|tara:strand:- start:81 stop:503 length:423 start_codon:yes stop_codon:yes gene_type:complete
MKRAYLLYGLMAGLLLLVIQVFEYKAMLRDLRLEIFGGIVAIIFLGLGVFVGVQVVKRRQLLNTINSNHDHGLSDRELEVLKLLADGLSNQQIADQLFVSLNTTKTHLAKIYQKLNVSRRTQAVQKAREIGVIGSSERTI